MRHENGRPAANFASNGRLAVLRPSRGTVEEVRHKAGSAFLVGVVLFSAIGRGKRIGQIFDEGLYECENLEKLIAAMSAEKKPWPQFVFSIDYGTIEGYDEAGEEFRKASIAYPGRVVLAPRFAD